MNKKKIYILLFIFGIIFTFFGGSLAYFQWETSSEQQTTVAFTITKDFECAVDGGGNITSNNVTLAPASCTNSTYAIQREVTVMPTIYDQNYSVYMDLWLDVNSLSSGLSDSQNFSYALTTSSTSCTEGVVSSGNFNGKTVGDTVNILKKSYISTLTDTYYLYIWLDSAETSSTTMNQTFNLSLNGNCTNGPKAFAIYSEDDNSLRFYKNNDLVEVGDTYNDLTVTDIYVFSETDEYTHSFDWDAWDYINNTPWDENAENVTNVVIEEEISPISTATWFADFENCTSIDLNKLDTSNVTDMSNMFVGFGKNVTTLNLNLSNLDVSNVTNMYQILSTAGYNSTTFNLTGLETWDVSNVTNMDNALAGIGYNATNWSISDISNWDVSSVTNMQSMFSDAGLKATTWSIGDISNWDTQNVTNMQSMFSRAGYNASTFNLDLSKWDVSSVTNMQSMFINAGRKATTWSIGDISNWDVSNVTEMYSMFSGAGYNASTFNLDLSKWDVSSVTNMQSMFSSAGYSATIWSIGNISNWNTSNVTTMNSMFNSAGYSATYSLDLSGWNVNKVTNYKYFNSNVTSKVTPPTWVN